MMITGWLGSSLVYRHRVESRHEAPAHPSASLRLLLVVPLLVLGAARSRPSTRTTQLARPGAARAAAHPAAVHEARVPRRWKPGETPTVPSGLKIQLWPAT